MEYPASFPFPFSVEPKDPWGHLTSNRVRDTSLYLFNMDHEISISEEGLGAGKVKKRELV